MVKKPVTQHERGPGGLTWLLAIIGMVLPWIAIPLGLLGLISGLRGHEQGWLWLGGAVVLLVLDIVIDVIWDRAAGARTDEPNLNRRGSDLAGRTAIVSEAIVGGRGKVQIGDTVWLAEGPDMPAGDRATIVACDGVVIRLAHITQVTSSQPEEPC
jgi:membrane protein implicated in regulation of membrane protease activity